MKKLLLLTSISLSALCCHFTAKAQIIFGAQELDSTTFNFAGQDSLTHHTAMMGIVTIDTAVADTADTRLWQIGSTIKPYFADSNTAKGIMTDTLNPYPVNANSSFKLVFNAQWANPIIGFTHRYQTTAGIDGGIVEISLDNGMIWQNVLTACNGDTSSSHINGVVTQNFYHGSDTLFNGDYGFSGNSNGWDTSWLQLLSPLPIRTSGSNCNFMVQTAELRFRFISDSVADSLDGWMIGQIWLRRDYYNGSVKEIAKQSLAVYPNPSANAIFYLPALENESSYHIEVMNALGERMQSSAYTHELNLGNFAKGLYFYYVSNGAEQYDGQLISE